MKANQKFRNDTRGAADLNVLLTALIITVIGVALIPVVVGTVADANTTGMSTATLALFNLIPLFYVILVVAIVVAFVKFSR